MNPLFSTQPSSLVLLFLSCASADTALTRGCTGRCPQAAHIPRQELRACGGDTDYTLTCGGRRGRVSGHPALSVCGQHRAAGTRLGSSKRPRVRTNASVVCEHRLEVRAHPWRSAGRADWALCGDCRWRGVSASCSTHLSAPSHRGPQREARHRGSLSLRGVCGYLSSFASSAACTTIDNGEPRAERERLRADQGLVDGAPEHDRGRARRWAGGAALPAGGGSSFCRLVQN